MSNVDPPSNISTNVPSERLQKIFRNPRKYVRGKRYMVTSVRGQKISREHRRAMLQKATERWWDWIVDNDLVINFRD